MSTRRTGWLIFGGIAAGALVVVAVVVAATLVLPGRGDGSNRAVSAGPTRSRTATASPSATPTASPTAVRTGHDSHTRYRPPHELCKKADFSAVRSMGLTDHPTDQSNTRGKEPIQECAYGWSTSSMRGSVTVEGSFERSAFYADVWYDMQRQDITSDKMKKHGHLTDGAEIGRKSFRYVQKPLGPGDAFLDLGTVDGTLVLIVSVYVHANDGPVTEKDNARLFRRMHRVAADTLRALRR